MKSLLSPGIVLQSHPIREADIVFTVLTKDRGRLSVLARGVRRSQKRFMGGIDLFDCGVFDLALPRANQNLHPLEGLSQREFWGGLRTDLAKYGYACYCAEITLQFSHEGDLAAGEYFEPLYRTLRAISKSEIQDESALFLIYYNLRLLQIAGYNFADNAQRLQQDTLLYQWFSQMLSQQQPILPFDRGLLRVGFQALASYSQDTLGRALRSIVGMPLATQPVSEV